MRTLLKVETYNHSRIVEIQNNIVNYENSNINKKTRFAKFVHKFLFYVLKKLKIEIYVKRESESFKYELLDIDDIVQKAIRNSMSFDYFIKTKPRYVIMSNKDLMNLRVKYQFQYWQQLPSDRSHVRREMLHDMEIINVPWIDGCFVLPDLNDIPEIR